MLGMTLQASLQYYYSRRHSCSKTLQTALQLPLALGQSALIVNLMRCRLWAVPTLGHVLLSLKYPEFVFFRFPLRSKQQAETSTISKQVSN
jgi:hypothetical protein